MHRGLTTGDHGNRSLAFCNPLDKFFDRNQGMNGYIPRLLYITPNTTNIKSTKPYKISFIALIKFFSLDRIEIFHDRKFFIKSFRFKAQNLKSFYGFRFSAARSVFNKSEAMVIGPTPPGTGVMKEVFGATSLKSTSPFNTYPFLNCGPSIRVVPTSMTTAPSFTISAVTN